MDDTPVHHTERGTGALASEGNQKGKMSRLATITASATLLIVPISHDIIAIS